MRRILAVGLAAMAIGGVPATSSAHVADGPTATVAHTCGSGYTHAHFPWGQKCLRRGQFCKGNRDRAYHRYGYHCHKRDARGNYHLT